MIGSIFAFIGWFLLGLLGLLILVLVFPVTAYFDYSGGKFGLKIRVLFLKFTIISKKEKKPKEEDKEKKQEKEEEDKKEKEEKEKKRKKKDKKEKRSLSEILNLVSAGLKETKKLFKYLTKWVYIRNVTFAMAFHSEDAAETAIYVSTLQGALYTLYAVLKSMPIHISFKTLQIVPDYANKAVQKAIFSCKVTVSPIIIIIIGLLGLKTFFELKDKDAEYMQNNREETQHTEE